MTDQPDGVLTLWGEPEPPAEPPPEKSPANVTQGPTEPTEAPAQSAVPQPPAEDPPEAAQEPVDPESPAEDRLEVVRGAAESRQTPYVDEAPTVVEAAGQVVDDAPALAGGADVHRPAWPPLVGGEAALAQLEAAVAAPVHAYLLVGARGSDKRAVARVFAAELLAAAAASEGPEAMQRHRQRALRGVHPDVLMVEPEGRALLAAEAASIITEAARQSVECARKVIVCDRFHTASQGVAASLLKTIEEPPAGTVIVLLADHVPPGHVTVASRCVTIEFRSPPLDEVQEWLMAGGAPADVARRAARAAAGDLARARDLLADDGLAGRFEAWWSLPERLDGTGARTAALVDELRGHIDAAESAATAAPAADPAESTDFTDRAESQRRRRLGRRVRDAELRFGFAVLADRYREALNPTAATPPTAAPAQAGETIDRLRAAAEALIRNPNEKLLLQDLLIHLPTHRA